MISAASISARTSLPPDEAGINREIYSVLSAEFPWLHGPDLDRLAALLRSNYRLRRPSFVATVEALDRVRRTDPKFRHALLGAAIRDEVRRSIRAAAAATRLQAAGYPAGIDPAPFPPL